MYTEVGGKIKGMAQFVCVVGILSCIIVGFMTSRTVNYSLNYSYGAVDLTNGATVSWGRFLLIAGLGSIGSWLGSLLIYGFGQLVEDTALIRSTVYEEKQYKTETEEKRLNEVSNDTGIYPGEKNL